MRELRSDKEEGSLKERLISQARGVWELPGWSSSGTKKKGETGYLEMGQAKHARKNRFELLRKEGEHGSYRGGGLCLLGVPKNSVKHYISLRKKRAIWQGYRPLKTREWKGGNHFNGTRRLGNYARKPKKSA